jgi:plasmid stability protein
LTQSFWLRYGCGMITLTIKGISKEAHRELKRRAATHGRSLNTEAIAVLEASTRSTPADREGVIERARQFRESLRFRVTPADLKRFQGEGRA